MHLSMKQSYLADTPKGGVLLGEDLSKYYFLIFKRLQSDWYRLVSVLFK